MRRSGSQWSLLAVVIASGCASVHRAQYLSKYAAVAWSAGEAREPALQLARHDCTGWQDNFCPRGKSRRFIRSHNEAETKKKKDMIQASYSAWQRLGLCPHIISVLQCLQFQTNEAVCHCLGPGASGIAVWNAKECFSSQTNNGFLTNTCTPRTWIICSKAGASSGAQTNNSPFWIMTLSLTLMLPRGSYGRWVSKEMPAWRETNQCPPLSCLHLYQ